MINSQALDCAYRNHFRLRQFKKQNHDNFLNKSRNKKHLNRINLERANNYFNAYFSMRTT
jgi:hypothetical protein